MTARRAVGSGTHKEVVTGHGVKASDDAISQLPGTLDRPPDGQVGRVEDVEGRGPARARRVVPGSQTEDELRAAEPVDVGGPGVLHGPIDRRSTGLDQCRRTTLIANLDADDDSVAIAGGGRRARGDQRVVTVAQGDQPASVEIALAELDVVHGDAVPAAGPSKDRDARLVRLDGVGIKDEQVGRGVRARTWRGRDDGQIGHR